MDVSKTVLSIQVGIVHIQGQTNGFAVCLYIRGEVKELNE